MKGESAEPVEDCVQNTLSALYPPFTATGPTLLCQVFAVVERTYGEDALRYAIEFLVPAKHILQRIQQEACSQYSGFLFCHEGWPLCLHEKVVVQLSSLPWQCLKPGDFYLQVLPYLECSPRLALKCLSQDGRSIQEVLVPEDSYPFIFTVEWLNGINKDRHASRLENCLLAAGERVLRVPWSEVVYPQFVHKDGFIVGRRCHIDPLPLLTSDERFSEILGDRSPGDGRMSNSDAKDLLGGLVKEAVESPGNGGCGFAENIEGEYVELLDLSLSPGLGVDSRQKYLEANGISKTKTIPVRKGHGKGRNKRHRAWLHQKLPKEDASLNKNPGHRTWEGSRTGNDAAGVHSKQEEGQQKHVHSTQGTYYDAILCGQTNVDLSGTGRPILAAEAHDSSLMEAKMPSAFVLDLHAKMACWEADVHSSPRQELEGFTLHTPDYSPGIKKHTIEGNYVDSLSLGDSLGPSSESVHTATDGKLSSPEPVCIDCKLSPSEYATTDGKLPSEEGESEPNTNCRHSPRPKEVLGTCLQGQCSTTQSDNETSLKLHQSASTTQETPSATTDLCVPGRMTEGTINEDPPAGETDKRETCVSHIKGYPEPSSSQEYQTIHHEREQKECRDGNEEQNKPTSQPPSNTLENAIDRETMHARKIGSPGSACHAAPRKHGKGKRKRKKGGGKTFPKPQEAQKAYMDMVGATEVPSEECLAPKEEELGPNAELEKPPESPEAGSQSEDALDEIGSDGDYIERRPEVVTKEKEGATGEQPDLESPALDKDTSIPPTSADFSNQSEDSLLLTSCAVDVEIPLVLPCQDHPCPGGEVTRQEVNWDVLQSGVFSLTGGVSLNGRALLIVAPQMTDSMYHSLCDQRDLLNALSHLRSLLRKQMQDLGLAVIMDLRSPGASQPPQEILFQALRELQETFPQSINFTLILTENTEAGPSTDEVATLKPVVLTGLDDLKDHVCVGQLPPSLGGTLPYSHSEWMQNHRTLDSLTQLCMEVVQSLLDVIEDLKLEVPTGTSQEIQALISKQQETMMKVLSDGRLSELQRNGGALIARLQKSCNHRMDVASAFDLYDEVDNTIHRLVQLSNQRLHSLEVHLEQCLKQEEVEEAVAWISGSGEKMLAGYSELGDSVTVLQQIQETFLGFQALAKEKIRRGRDALGQVDSFETFTVQDKQRFQTTIEDFLQALEKKEQEIQKTITLQEFFQRAHKWTLEGVKRLAAISDRSGSAKQNQDVLASLAQYQQQHPVIPEKLFQKMKALALELQSQKALREWTQCWSKCQEMEKIFHKKMEVALKDKKALEKDQFSHESFNGRKTSAPEKDELSPEALKCKKPIFIDKGQLSPKVLKSKKGNSEKTEPSTEIPRGKKITGKEKGQLSPDAFKGKNVSVTEEAQQRPEALKVKKPTSPGKLQTNQDALKVKKTASPDKVPSGSDGHRKRSDSISAVMEKGEGRRFWGLGSMLSPSRSMTSLLIPQASSSGPSHQEAPSFKSLAHSGVLAEDSDWDQVFVESERYEGSRVGLGSTASRAPTLPVCEKVSQDSRSRSPMSEGTASPCLKPRVVSPKGLLLKKSQSTVSPPSKGQRSFSEPIPGQGKVGVYIRGLEVSSTEVVDRTCSPKEHVMIGRGGALSADAPWGGTPRMERKRRIGNLQRLMSEAIGCEQEYVTALGLLLEVLALELEKRELLAEQRQEFGDLLSNVEKLHAFHSGYFLQELEGCLSHPLRVATCFVRYADQISLYSLYVKNRHKIENNLACNRSTFKPGQDDTDARLLQHLQRPLEQLEQYWRFLDEMVHECSQELVQERQSLCMAQELLLSQVHHGKNLMAVDSIKGFEVDLKEHGQLLLRDEFTIFSGRKKCQRHVFLFEHLLLFSKLKITDAGLETYSYKQAFKTADMGLTENIGDSGLRFELWFRRRKNREAFTFQTGCVETKNRWTTVTAQLLWHQATDSKERQSSEVVSIGPGNKSFLDIKASFGALSERTINALLMTRGSRTRASVAVSSFDHSGPCRQSSCPSTSPSTMALGPFNFQFPFLHSSTSPSSPGASSLAGSIAEEDWEYLACKTSPGAEPAGGVSRSVSQRDSRFAISIGKKTQNQSLFISQFGQGHQSTGKDQTSPNPSTSL